MVSESNSILNLQRMQQLSQYGLSSSTEIAHNFVNLPFNAQTRQAVNNTLEGSSLPKIARTTEKE